MWQEVARLAHEDGVTVFLTTQYLEEADVLADRIAIIDRGRIVARGTPDELKAEIGRPTLEVEPVESRTTTTAVAARARALRHAGHGAPRRGRRAPERRRRAAPRGRARARRREPHGGRLPAARADARRRVPRQDRAQARGRRARRRARGRCRHEDADLRDGAARDPPDAAPACAGDPAGDLPADHDGHQHRRPGRGDEPARLPRRHLPRLRDRGPVHAGVAVRVHQRRRVAGARRRDAASSSGWR